jgi:hypothetical protein
VASATTRRRGLGFALTVVTPAPEPGHLVLALTGGLVLANARRKRRA